MADEKDGAAGLWSGGIFFAFPGGRIVAEPRPYSAEDFRRRVSRAADP